MTGVNQLLTASVLLVGLVLVSARDLRKRISIEQIGDGCRVGKTSSYVCCFECATCNDLGVTGVPSCRGRRAPAEHHDYWMQRRVADYWDNKAEEKRSPGSLDNKAKAEEKRSPQAEERRSSDYWDLKRALDYWTTKGAERRSSDYWDTRELTDYWQEKRASPCRVKVYEGVHRCCLRKYGCACPRDVVARCG